MTARRIDIGSLPDWPRGLSLEQAAAYVGVSAETFRRHVGIPPRRVGDRKVWDRRELDAWFDSDRSRTEHGAEGSTLGERAALWEKSE